MPAAFDYELCDGCGKCAAGCPGDVIHMRGEPGNRLPFNRYSDECWHCGSCRQDCPPKAIRMVFPPDMLCV
jgi:NAD-dependent dihydropyrimidine dehydrogenase PreA subunit